MANPYRPPIKGSTLTMPWLSLVHKADPDFERAKHRQIEYEGTGRALYADPDKRGAYNNNPN